MSGEQAFFSRHKEGVDATKVLHLARQRLMIEQIREYPANLLEAKCRRHLKHLAVIRIVEQFNRVFGALLRRLVNRNHSSANAERHIGRHFVRSVEKADTLVSGDAPIIEELIDNAIILEHHVVDMTISLPIECDCRWLTLGANTFGPWWMIATAALNLTIDILEGDEFTAIHARCHLS